MATCMCAGGLCNCEAIQVPPKLPFWKKHDRHVHGFVAWMAVINVALLGALPLAMSAHETNATSTATTKPPVTSGVDSCIQRCNEEARKCVTTSASGTAEQTHVMCETKAKDCLSRCLLAPQLGLPSKDASASATAKKPTKSASSSVEAREKAQADKVHLVLAKKRIAGFARNLASVKSKIALIEKNGMRVPTSLKTTVVEGEALVAKVRAATTMADLGKLGEVQSTMERITNALKKELRSLEKQKGAPQKFTALEKQLRQMDQQLATLKRISGATSTPEIAAVEQSLNDIKVAYRQAHDLIVAGDVEGGFKIIEAQLPGLMAKYKEALKAAYTARANKKT